METSEAKPRSVKKKPHGCLIALLIVVLIPVLLVGGFCLYLSTPGLAYADAETAANPPNMTVNERFFVDADTRTLSMCMDANDFLWLVGGENAPVPLAEVQQALAPYRLEIRKYGVQIADGKVIVNAKVRALGVVGLPVRATLSCGKTNGAITFALESAQLGTRINLPIDAFFERFSIDRGDLTFSIDANEYPWLSRLSNVLVQDDAIVLTFPLDTRITAPLMSNIRTVRDTAYYVEADEFMPLSVALEASNNGSSDYLGDAFNAALSRMEADSKAFVDFRVQTLAMLTEPSANSYLNHAGINTYAPRFVPGFDRAAVDAARTQIDGLRRSRSAAFVDLYDRLIDACKAGELTLDKSGFLNTSTGEPMQFAEFMENPADYAGWFHADRMKLMFLIGVPQLALDYPTLGELKQNKGALPGKANKKLSVRPCLLAGMADDTQFLYYYNSLGELVTLPDDLFRDSYDALLNYEGLTFFAPLDDAAARTGYILK